MDRTLVMMRPDGAAEAAGRDPDLPVEERVREERKRYTTQLQRRAQAHVTAELGVDAGAADLDRQVAMLIQHAMEVTGARRVTLFRPAPRGQRWHAATVLEDGCFHYGLIAPEQLVLPMIAYHQKLPLLLSPERPHDIAAPRPADLGFRTYLGVPVKSGGEVVAVVEAVDVARSDDLDRYAGALEQAVAALAETIAADSRRHGWRPQDTPTHGLSDVTVLDLVLRPPFDADDTIEVSPQEWALLNQLNGERTLGDAAEAAVIQPTVAAAVAASLLERGLIRVGRDNRRRG